MAQHAAVAAGDVAQKTLANWVFRARKGQALVKRQPGTPAAELGAEVARLRQENAKLRVEKEILIASSVLCQGVDVKYAWIEANRDSYSVTMMCELLSDLGVEAH